MDKQKIKITFKNYVFELHFKTDYCLSMTVTDIYQGLKFQNNNVEFKKINKPTIVGALQQKNQKEILCKVTEVVMQQQFKMSKQAQLKNNPKRQPKQKCLKVQFFVTLAYVLPFSEEAMLYQMDSCRKLSNLLPKKLTAAKAKQLKKQIQLVESLIPTGQQNDDLKIFQINSMILSKPQNETDRQNICLLAAIIALIVIWIIFLTFLQFLTISILVAGSIFIYFRAQKFSVQTIYLKKGHYKIDVTGCMTINHYAVNQHDSFVLIASFNAWDKQSNKLHINNSSGYAYPFGGCFLIESKKDQDLKIQIQKNIKIYPATLSNMLITVQKIPPPLFIKS